MWLFGSRGRSCARSIQLPIVHHPPIRPKRVRGDNGVPCGIGCGVLLNVMRDGLLGGRSAWSSEPTRALRRRLQRRSKLVRSRTRAKNECRAVLQRNRKRRPPMTDVFGKAGRTWLAALELPADESETLECCLREGDFLDHEVSLIERELARQAMSCHEIRRPMSVPGVSLVSAAAFVAATGEIQNASPATKKGLEVTGPRICA